MATAAVIRTPLQCIPMPLHTRTLPRFIRTLRRTSLPMFSRHTVTAAAYLAADTAEVSVSALGRVTMEATVATTAAIVDITAVMVVTTADTLDTWVVMAGTMVVIMVVIIEPRDLMQEAPLDVF